MGMSWWLQYSKLCKLNASCVGCGANNFVVAPRSSRLWAGIAAGRGILPHPERRLLPQRDFGIPASNPTVGSIPHRDFAIHGSNPTVGSILHRDFAIHGSNPMVGSIPHRDFAVHGSRQGFAEVFYGALRDGGGRLDLKV